MLIIHLLVHKCIMHNDVYMLLALLFVFMLIMMLPVLHFIYVCLYIYIYICIYICAPVYVFNLDYFEYAKFNYDIMMLTFFCFRPFTSKFCPKNPSPSSLLAETRSQWLFLFSFYIYLCTLNSTSKGSWDMRYEKDINSHYSCFSRSPLLLDCVI